MGTQNIYNNIRGLEYVSDCLSIDINECLDYMRKAKRANKRQVNRLVKRFLPELFDALCLNFYNPYNYYRTEEHLILVHSGIEYFLLMK